MTSDLELLQDYARNKSEESFAALVKRHLNLVFSAALRQVRSPQLAEEVAQAVFVDLSQSAAKLRPDTILTAWLYQITRRTAIDVVRRESRRQLREQVALEMNAINAAEVDWRHIEPLLDDAMGALEETDRAAVLLRYFENKSLREVGATLGTSDDAAQKRVSRAVERLREFFAKRGVTVGASGLAVVISANAVQAAPVGLALTISTAAALTGTTLATTTTITATKAIAMTALQKTIVTGTIAVLAGAGIYEARQAAQLRDQVQTLRQQQTPTAEQIQKLQSERDAAANRLSVLADEIEKDKGKSMELLKLRDEVTRLRGDSRELAQLKATETNDPAQVELKSWLARVKQLKQEAENNPRARIPEFSLLTEQDWLNAAKSYGQRTQFDPETNLRIAMAELRQAAQNNFANWAKQALSRYVKDHDGRFPASLDEFQSYLPIAVDGQPVDSTILQRYKIEPAAKLHMEAAGQDWVLTQKALVDEEYDHVIAIGPQSWGYKQSEADQLPPDIRALKRTLDPIAKEFATANNGQEPADPSQLLPYLKTDEQRTALQKVIELRNSPARTNK